MNVRIAAAMFLIALMLGACSALETYSKQKPLVSEIATPELQDLPAPPATGEPVSASGSGDDEPVYFGEWTVTGTVASAAVSGEADGGLIGARAAYGAEQASFGDERAAKTGKPAYNKSCADFVYGVNLFSRGGWAA